MTKSKKCITNIHPICISSDSKLPECLCWCAECKEQKEIGFERNESFMFDLQPRSGA
jgi:hypothetical protein